MSAPGRFRLHSTVELLKLPPPTWVVDGMIPSGGMVGLYGPPGSYKSFLAMDFAMSIATGTAWNGRRVEPGNGLYVGAEGGRGIGIRAGAWCQHHDIHPRKVPVAWLLEAVPVYGDSEEIDQVFERLGNQVKREPKVIVIDTLARCFDGNENEQEDMGRFIAGADRFRREFDATVIIVHHTRLDGDRERGNTAFRGAADAMLSVTKNGASLVLSCNKQKDAEEFGMLGLRLLAVAGTDSCVLVPAKANKAAEKHEIALMVLEENGGVLSYSEWLSAVGSAMSPATFKRTIVSLEEKGKILKKNSKYQGIGLTK